MIREKRPGVWEIVIYLGSDPVTKKKQRISRTVHGTKKAAEKAERAIRFENDQGEHDRRRDTEATVSILMDAWLEQARPDLSPSTLHGYERYNRVHIEPALGAIALSNLTTRRLDLFYSKLRAPGAGRYGRDLSPTTVHHVHAILHRALDQAVRWEWIATNPATNASPPKLDQPEIVPPAPDTVARILEAAEAQDVTFATLIWLAAVTGARRGELCALRWDRVELDAARLTISHSIVEDADGNLHEKSTKTRKVRRVKIDPVTVRILTDHATRAVQIADEFDAELAPDAYVFSEDALGRTPIAPARISSRWRRLRDALDLDVRLHDLRHFNVTESLAAGVPVGTVAGRVGHGGGGRTTMQVYAHFLESADDDAAEKIGTVMVNARDARQEARRRTE